MKKSYLAVGIIVILIVIFACIYVSYIVSEDSGPKTTVEVSADSYMNMTVFVKEIKNHPYFNAHNNDTLSWLESIDDNYIVVSSGDAYYIMSPVDADKVPFEFATDVSIYDTIEFNIIDEKSLGDDLRDVCLVENVEFVSQRIISYDT